MLASEYKNVILAENLRKKYKGFQLDIPRLGIQIGRAHV